MQPSLRHLKFHRLAAAGLVFLFSSVAFLPQAGAGNLASDPNALQKIQQFIFKPAPDDLLLKPKIKKQKKQAKSAKN